MPSGKSFEEHSKRWQDRQRRSGADPKRWDAWDRLSPNTKRNVDREEYSRGIPAPRLVREKRESDLVQMWADKLKAAGAKRVRPGKLRSNIRKMSQKQKRHIVDDDGQTLIDRANPNSDRNRRSKNFGRDTSKLYPY